MIEIVVLTDHLISAFNCVDPSVNPDSVSDHQNDSGGENDDITSSSLITKAELIKEQRDDETLRGCWKLAERGRGSFLIDDGILYRREKILGQSFQQLVVPERLKPEPKPPDPRNVG